MAKTAFEAGWRVSRYNLSAPIPGTNKVAIANLFKGTCGAYSPLDLFLLNELETLDAEHPILDRFRERGLIVNFDERAALEAGRLMALCEAKGAEYSAGIIAFQDAPEKYVLALYDRIGEEKGADEQSTVTGREPK